MQQLPRLERIQEFARTAVKPITYSYRNINLVTDPAIEHPGFFLPRRQWTNTNRIRTLQSSDTHMLHQRYTLLNANVAKTLKPLTISSPCLHLLDESPRSTQLLLRQSTHTKEQLRHSIRLTKLHETFCK